MGENATNSPTISTSCDKIRGHTVDIDYVLSRIGDKNVKSIFNLGILAVAAVAISACAKQPDEIAAIPMESSMYAGQSCSSLSQTKLKLSQDLASLSAQQKSAASGDAFGVFMLGLPLSSMSGGDKEAAISVTKGKIDAINQEMARKRCQM